jgi:hypothetical protein
MFHMNIASLQAHIDELKSLLTLLDHPFDAICITEISLDMISYTLLLPPNVEVLEYM